MQEEEEERWQQLHTYHATKANATEADWTFE